MNVCKQKYCTLKHIMLALLAMNAAPWFLKQLGLIRTLTCEHTIRSFKLFKLFTVQLAK